MQFFALFACIILVGSACATRAPAVQDATVDAVSDLAVNDLASTDDGPLDTTVDASADAGDVVDAGDVWRPLYDGNVPVWVTGDLANLPAPQSECAPETRMRPGDATLAPPRPVMPFSVSRSSSSRVRFRWILPEGVTGTRIEICRDRCCTQVVRTVDVAQGTEHQLVEPLGFGVHFWRLFGRVGERVGARPSATWEFRSPRVSSAESTSYDTLRDMDGDGLDEGIYRSDFGATSIVEWNPNTGSVSHREVDRFTSGGVMGDFNGDGIAEYVGSTEISSESGLRLISRQAGHFVVRGIAAPGGLDGLYGGWPLGQSDLNGDGYSDLVALYILRDPELFDPDIVLVYLGNPRGLRQRPQYFLVSPVGRRGAPVAIHDMLGDGTGDLILWAGTSRVQGEATHLYTSIQSTHQSMMSSYFSSRDSGVVDFAAIGDITGDSFPDLKVALPPVNLRNPIAVYSEAQGVGLNIDSHEVIDRGGRAAYYWAVADVRGDGHVGSYVGSSLVFCTLPRAEEGSVCLVNMPLSFELVPGDPPRLTNPLPAASAMIRPQVYSYVEMMMLGDINGDGADDLVRPFDVLCVQTSLSPTGYVCERSRFQDGGL